LSNVSNNIWNSSAALYQSINHQLIKQTTVFNQPWAVAATVSTRRKYHL